MALGMNKIGCFLRETGVILGSGVVVLEKPSSYGYNKAIIYLFFMSSLKNSIL